jgi:predicted RNA-binding Zn-ribbon protein involved in translation (DUF1610 family)
MRARLKDVATPRRSADALTTGGDDLDEPAELFFYCPECGDRELGGA